MKALAGNVLLCCFLSSASMAPQMTAPGKAPALPAPTPPQKRGDRPVPPATSVRGSLAAPVSSAPILNTPQHSPDQLDFGTVADGGAEKKTFRLTTNASGYVTANIPPGPFQVVEFREMGPVQGGSKNPGGQSPVAAFGAVRSRIRYQEGQNGPFQWSMASNVEMQLDIVFAPKIRGGSAGPKSATMNMTGPGPRGNWALTIPLRGTLSNLKVSSEPPQQKYSSDQQKNRQELEPAQQRERLRSQGLSTLPRR